MEDKKSLWLVKPYSDIDDIIYLCNRHPRLMDQITSRWSDTLEGSFWATFHGRRQLPKSWGYLFRDLTFDKPREVELFCDSIFPVFWVQLRDSHLYISNILDVDISVVANPSWRWWKFWKPRRIVQKMTVVPKKDRIPPKALPEIQEKDGIIGIGIRYKNYD